MTAMAHGHATDREARVPREVDEAWIEAAAEHYRRLERCRAVLAERAASADVTVRSGDGLVEIVVTADGVFRDVRIADSALRTRTAGELSRTVLAACQQARTAAEWATEKLHEQLFAGLRYPD